MKQRRMEMKQSPGVKDSEVWEKNRVGVDWYVDGGLNQSTQAVIMWDTALIKVY